MKTNLDIARKYFKKATFNGEDTYGIDHEYTIQWLGEGELFTVDRNFYDDEVGYVNSPEMFSGDFRQCLEFCLGHKIDAQDVAALEELKVG